MRLNALIGEFFVNLERRIIESQFDDRKIRRCWLEIFTQPESSQLQFGLIQIGKRFTEVHQHKIALVPDQREQRGLTVAALLHSAQHRRRFLCNCRTRGLGKRLPCRPFKTHHLMQDAITLGCKRNVWDLSGSILPPAGVSRYGCHWILTMSTYLDSASIVRKGPE